MKKALTIVLVLVAAAAVIFYPGIFAMKEDGHPDTQLAILFGFACTPFIVNLVDYATTYCHKANFRVLVYLPPTIGFCIWIAFLTNSDGMFPSKALLVALTSYMVASAFIMIIVRGLEKNKEVYVTTLSVTGPNPDGKDIDPDKAAELIVNSTKLVAANPDQKVYLGEEQYYLKSMIKEMIHGTGTGRRFIRNYTEKSLVEAG